MVDFIISEHCYTTTKTLTDLKYENAAALDCQETFAMLHSSCPAYSMQVQILAKQSQ